MVFYIQPDLTDTASVTAPAEDVSYFWLQISTARKIQTPGSVEKREVKALVDVDLKWTARNILFQQTD